MIAAECYGFDPDPTGRRLRRDYTPPVAVRRPSKCPTSWPAGVVVDALLDRGADADDLWDLWDRGVRL